MCRYGVFQDGGYYDDVDTLEQAVGLAEELLGGVTEGELSTFTVKCEGRLLASVTNRDIQATFHMQYRRRGAAALDCGRVDFNATGHVLRMEPDALRALRDGEESSAAVGLAHIDWDGPCRVILVDAVCAFFGVADLAEITDEALAFVRRRRPGLEVTKTGLRLTFDVWLLVEEGASIGEFMQDLDCRITSRTSGVSVIDTKFVDYC